MAILSHTLIDFRPLKMGDLRLLHQWFAHQHVAAWYREESRLSYEGVVAKYAPAILGDKPIHCFIITYGGKPIGQIQTYCIADHTAIDVDEGMAGVDLFIGDPAYVHQGLGGPILQHFLRAIVFGIYDATSCLIDPEAKNTVAIRAYEKAGFHHLQTVQTEPGGPFMYLMRIDRANLRESSAPQASM